MQHIVVARESSNCLHEECKSSKLYSKTWLLSVDEDKELELLCV